MKIVVVGTTSVSSLNPLGPYPVSKTFFFAEPWGPITIKKSQILSKIVKWLNCPAQHGVICKFCLSYQGVMFMKKQWRRKKEPYYNTKLIVMSTISNWGGLKFCFSLECQTINDRCLYIFQLINDVSFKILAQIKTLAISWI